MPKSRMVSLYVRSPYAFMGQIYLLRHNSVQTALGPTQPPTQWVPGALSPEVKLQWRKADHSPPLPHTALWRAT
jgi:hypothetical protein